MKRLPDWEDRLIAFMDRARRKPFQWSVFDCCTFPADAVLALTGVDPMVDLRDAYDDARSALMLINGNGGLEELTDKRLVGAECITSLKGQRGDIVHLEQQGLGARLGVIWGAGVAAPGLRGLITLQRPMAAKTWHIGY